MAAVLADRLEPANQPVQPATGAVLAHHGGSDSFTECVRAGVPALLLPFSSDQLFVAWDAEGSGAGVVADPNAVGAGRREGGPRERHGDQRIDGEQVLGHGVAHRLGRSEGGAADADDDRVHSAESAKSAEFAGGQGHRACTPFGVVSIESAGDGPGAVGRLAFIFGR
ncbi:hypothetical protein [Streptomyces sp. NPDC086182]|uniref:hypothetical protein n=1 Tax=Streptomyces sp. NPDC086182 TaxID=3155058 RepID=UPI00341368BA